MESNLPPASNDGESSTPGSRSRAPKGAVGRAQARTRVHAHCGVYTDVTVVGMMLDLVGWTAASDLADARLLEPSCGDGAFVAEAARRLVRSRPAAGISALIDMIVAFEFEAATARRARANVAAALQGEGMKRGDAVLLAKTWIRTEDFLTSELDGTFSHVVGNPPYMRWSLVPDILRNAYRKALPAHVAKGDLCLGFVWRGLQTLRPDTGAMAFLCADRWLRCAYGAGVREAFVKTHALVAHVEVHDVPVFTGDRAVSAYAAISLIRARANTATFFARATSTKDLRASLKEAQAHDAVCLAPAPAPGRTASRISLVEEDTAWAIDLLRAGGAPLGSAGVQVKCGVALGAVKVFVVDPTADIEADRLVPLIRSVDVAQDGAVTAVRRVINVWTEGGELVDLSAYPKLSAHLEAHRAQLTIRACVGEPHQWYRSIDKIDLGRVAAPKVLVVGMAKHARVGLDAGGSQHGNALYALTSSTWPVTALRRLLDGGVLELFGVALSPRFSGGTKRFDGHVLSQVHLPTWDRVPIEARTVLLDPATIVDADVVAATYRVSGRQRARTLRHALEACAGRQTSSEREQAA
ncbi:Eco57I restriction-modification methylase domain-containing protein [Phenylobacterium sp.]|uniref:Eco57I restriction-modification methylase domain-containing protein n=1 Tax=Phenylobacterium sp. TaxID=1871053 RepID=UPI002FC93C02